MNSPYPRYDPKRWNALTTRPDLDTSGLRCGGRSNENNYRATKILGSSTSVDQVQLFRRVAGPIKPKVQVIENVIGYGGSVKLKEGSDDEGEEEGGSDEGGAEEWYNLLSEHHSQMYARGYTSASRQIDGRDHDVNQARKRIFNADVEKSVECGQLSNAT